MTRSRLNTSTGTLYLGIVSLGLLSVTTTALTLASLGFCIQSSARKELQVISETTKLRHDNPPIYLPAARTVKLVTLGYNNLASNILWFNTINYFGKQLRSTHDYRWLEEMCLLVTTLDPRKAHVFEFCSNMLSWEAKEFDKSIAMLDRAITAMPERWRFWYLRGFSYWYFKDRKDLAQQDLVHASKLPGAPSFLATLAARLKVDSGSPEAAIAFLNEIYNNTTDENARKVLADKLQRGYLSRDLRILQRLVDNYREQHGSLPKKLEDALPPGKSPPPEPFGGRYLLDTASGKVTTSSGEIGLEFMGRNKDSGIFGMENRIK